MNITLYKNSAKPYLVDKTNHLTFIDNLNGEIRDETSIIDMVMTIEYNKVPNFNYVYISSFKRYYYVTNIVSIRTNLWEIHLSVDVLMTYKNELLNCTAFVDRNEKYFAPYSIDGERVIRQGSYVEQALPLTQQAPFPNVSILDIEDLTYPSEFCIVLNGYKISAVDY